VTGRVHTKQETGACRCGGAFVQRRENGVSWLECGSCGGPAPVAGILAHPAEILAEQVKGDGLPAPRREVLVCPTRRWRFDLAWPTARLAVEIQGWRHDYSLPQIRSDREKYNAAAMAGWRVLQVSPAEITGGQAIAMIARALAVSAASVRAAALAPRWEGRQRIRHVCPRCAPVYKPRSEQRSSSDKSGA
jgi:hypothetical protein